MRAWLILILLMFNGCGKGLGESSSPSLNVNNGGGNAVVTGTCPSVTTPSCGTDCYLFSTNHTFDGNLGGVAGADVLCNTDPNKPNGSNYKAFIVDGVSRQANPCVDWVMAPNTNYKWSTGTHIGTTDANGVLITPLSNAMGFAMSPYWTGVNVDLTSSGNDCDKWTNNASGTASTSHIGSGTTASAAWSEISYSCSSFGTLYCAEQ